MSLKDLTQFTDVEAVRDHIAELLRDWTGDDAGAGSGIAGLTDAEITGLLPHVTDELSRDALVRVLWTRAAQEASAEHAATRAPE
jgi:hypothetical protein